MDEEKYSRNFWGRDVKEVLEIMSYSCKDEMNKILKVLISKNTKEGYDCVVTLKR